MENFGFKILDKAECDEKDLPASVGSFNMLFNKMEDEMRINPKLKYGDADNMSDPAKLDGALNLFAGTKGGNLEGKLKGKLEEVNLKVNSKVNS